MRSFFIRLFLSFWLATFGIMAAALVFFRELPSDAPPDLREPLEQLTTRSVRMAIEGVAVQGCVFLQMAHIDGLDLFDSAHQPLCGAESAVNLGEGSSDQAHPVWVTKGAETFQAGSIRDSHGTIWYYTAKVPRPRVRSMLPPFPLVALPSSALVSLLFAYFLARPVRALSSTIRDFSAGNLSARASIHPVIPGFGSGGDLETLTRDFNAMADRIQGLIEAHQTLIRDVSHELRTPLTRIRMALELAREESESPGPYLLRMEAECVRFDQLLSGILHLSHLGRIEALERADRINLVTLIGKIVEDVRLEANRKCTGLEFKPSIEEMNVYGDPELLRQAIENVVRNAIRFSPRGEVVEICVESRGMDLNSHTAITVEVHDRGPGMSSVNLEKVFVPFFRVASEKKDAPDGFGVGLAIAEQAVRLHGGRISAEKRSGGGLTVAINLPGLQHLN